MALIADDGGPTFDEALALAMFETELLEPFDYDDPIEPPGGVVTTGTGDPDGLGGFGLAASTGTDCPDPGNAADFLILLIAAFSTTSKSSATGMLIALDLEVDDSLERCQGRDRF